MIKFLCPNGHPLSAPENLAGKPGKCPKCGTPFVIPDEGPEPELHPGVTAEGDGTAASGGSMVVTPAMGSGKGLAAGGEIFVFLCPNGHKLHGPPTLKGKPGQCPHCGARFRIPTDEDVQAAEAEATAGGDDDEEILAGEPEEGADFDRLFGGEDDQEAVVGAIAVPPAGPSGLGYIFGRLWERRTEQTELEIFLSEGEIVAPDYYSEVLSSSDFGVFAVQQADGTLALTVIPWGTVRRVTMRRISELPGELFQ